MGKESTPDEGSVIADEHSFDVNRTIEDENLSGFSNISVTGLVALFEDKINQKLAQLIPQNNLPGNVEFCLINIATDAQDINATFNVVVPSSPTPTAHRTKPIAIL